MIVSLASFVMPSALDVPVSAASATCGASGFSTGARGGQGREFRIPCQRDIEYGIVKGERAPRQSALAALAVCSAARAHRGIEIGERDDCMREGAIRETRRALARAVGEEARRIGNAPTVREGRVERCARDCIAEIGAIAQAEIIRRDAVGIAEQTEMLRPELPSIG